MSVIRIELVVRYETEEGEDVDAETLDALERGVLRGIERLLIKGLLTGGDLSAVVAEYDLGEVE